MKVGREFWMDLNADGMYLKNYNNSSVLKNCLWWPGEFLTKAAPWTPEKRLFSKLMLLTLALGILFFIPMQLDSRETGYKYLKNYTYKEYDHQPQNWEFVQAENGVIYVANDGGVLEYDGVSWRVIKVPGYDLTRSITIDKNGTIYVGGKNKIGYITPDSKGSWEYRSLLAHLNGKYKNLSNVWGTHAVEDSIYFRTLRYLLRWHSGRFIVQEGKAKHLFIASFVYNDTLYVQQFNKGLMEVKNGFPNLIPGGKTFADTRIVMFTSGGQGNSNNAILIGTRTKGLFLYDGKTVKPFPLEDTAMSVYLKENILAQGIRLVSGDFALATRKDGLVIMDYHGRVKQIYDKSSSLQEENIRCLMEDRQGNIWLALSTGISKIEYGSPFYHYDKRSGLHGLILSFTRHGDGLYAGTTDGLYVLPFSSNTFHPIPGIDVKCWSLLSLDGSLLAATSWGVFHIEKNHKQKIIDSPSYFLLPSSHRPGLVWCGTKKGLTALAMQKGNWTAKHRFDTITDDIRFIAEDQKGNVWLSLSPKGILKVDFAQGITKPIVTAFSPSSGLPAGRVYVALAAEHMMFATDKGIFRYDETKNVFSPDRTLGAPFTGDHKNGIPVFRIVEGINKTIWIHSQSRNYRAVPGPGKSFEISATPFRRIPLAQIQGIFPSADGKNVWLAGFDGLIRYDTTLKKNYRQSFATLIRKVNINENEKLIFNGCTDRLIKGAEGSFPVLDYRERNIYFQFAASFFEAENETHYRYFLEGYDKGWSSWDKDTERYYTNLDSGSYRFRVQARNIYHREGTEAQFRFKVLPPWYQTWWAWLIYAIGGILVVLGIVRWRSFKLVSEKKKLETTVMERTREIKAQSDRLEEQTVQLRMQSEKLKELDKVKSRFFANISHEFRTPLTLILSPLEQMLSEAGRDKREKKKLNVMLRSSQRLLTLINQLLELARFDSGKVKLQAACQDIVSFVKKILDSFHDLARQNQLDLEFQSSEVEIDIYFDAPKMEEVMYNLLINAVKFTPPGGTITVSISVEPRFLNISIQDTGVGIPTEQLPHIFNRFFQSQSRLRKKTFRGSGIGLALTKETVELHQGIIDVHSSEEKGTEFVIRLPLGHQHFKPDEIVIRSDAVPDRDRKKEMERLYRQPDDEGEEAGEIEPTASEEQPNILQGEHGWDLLESSAKVRKMVILIVEDEADVRKYIREPLESIYEVIEAGDGKDGIDKAKKIIPDLIVSDIMMPGIDGYELCRELKKDFNTSHIPIILLTAKASEESTLKGLEKGADDYITKPFHTKMLLARIRNLIDLRQQLQLKIQRKKMLLPEEIEVSPQDERFIKDVKRIIAENLSDPEFDIKALQQKLRIGRMTLFRKIEAFTGETPNQFLQSYRLERGAQLLRKNFGNVTEVAMAAGFDSPEYFAKCFKKKYYQTPSSYQASESKG